MSADVCFSFLLQAAVVVDGPFATTQTPACLETARVSRLNPRTGLSVTFGVGCEASDAGPFVREGGRPPRGNLIITQTALDFNLAQTPAAPIRMGKETQSAHFRFCNSRTRV